MKCYRVEYSERTLKALKKMDAYTKRMIIAWIEKHLVGCENPRRLGKGLTANLSGQWRYRIGDYRLLCEIKDDELVILAISVGHRRSVYEMRN